MRALLPLAMLLVACDGEAECGYDVDCPIGSRCAGGECVSIEVPPDVDGGADAAVGADAGGADAGADGGQDAGPDASTPDDCQLALAPEGGVEIASAIDDEPVAFVRAGPDGSFGLLHRAAVTGGVTVLRIDEGGAPMGGAIGPLNGADASPKLSMASSEDGTLLAVWVEDDSVHAALVLLDDFVALAPLSEAADGTFQASAARSGDGFVVAWADDAAGRGQVSTIALDGAGVPLAPAARLDTPAGARLPALASGAEDEVPIVWQDDRSGEPRLHGGFRAADGTILAAELSSMPVVQTAALTRAGASVYAIWTVPPLDGDFGTLQLTRDEAGNLEQRELDQVVNLDPRLSIAWDGSRLFVGWHSGVEAEARATLLAVSTDLEVLSSLPLPEGTQGARTAADGVGAAVAWIETASSTIRFATLSCE